MRILGLDPGYALVGWAVLEIEGSREVELVDFGCITTPKETEMGARLAEIYSDLKGLIERFSPEYAGVETLLFQKNAKTAMGVSQARGVLLMALSQADVVVREVSPMQVKSSMCGYGKATKKQVQESVMLLCGLSQLPKPDDAADAIAIAVTAYDHLTSLSSTGSTGV